MRQIGIVKQVQIQQSSLKIGERPQRVYTTDPLLVVDGLRLNPAGAVGPVADGAQIVDVHNADHPQSRNAGNNGVSFSFTGHYQALQAKFGGHMREGCAGENILIEAEGVLAPEEIGMRLGFQNPITDTIVYLTNILAAAPCVEFSHFAHKTSLATQPLPPEVVKATVQFLDNGMRGYYARASEVIHIQAGDKVFAVDAL